MQNYNGDSEYKVGRLNDPVVTEAKDTYNSMPMKCDYSVKTLGFEPDYAPYTKLFGGAV